MPFFAKWLKDLQSEQTKEHGVPHYVPTVGNEEGCACWGDVATIVPYTMYTVYGDKRILAEQYQSMKDWVEYIRSKSTGYLWKSGFQYGDWLALDKEECADRIGATDKYLIATAYFAYSALIVKKTAEVLGKGGDIKKYGTLYKNIVKAFNNEYVTRTGRMVSETQTAFVLALYFNLIEDKFRNKLTAGLRDNLANHNDHLVTGFVGTPYLMHALSENGLHDLAVKLFFNDDYPSWLYEVKLGATTIWERWNGILPNGELFNPKMNSYNHYAYGSVGDWMYRKLAGIDCLEAGYKKIKIKPLLAKGITSINATYNCVYGKIAVGYSVQNNRVKYRIEIPVNTTAEIELEGLEKTTVGSGIYEYEINSEV